MRLVRRVLSRLGSADRSASRLPDFLRSGGLNMCRTGYFAKPFGFPFVAAFIHG